MVVDLDNTQIPYHIILYQTIPNTTKFETAIIQPVLQLRVIPTYYTIPYYTKPYLTIPNTTKFETAITGPFFKLEAPNFAW